MATENNTTEISDPPTDNTACNGNLLGKSVLVPVENLIQPEESRAVREIDLDHVRELEQQFELSKCTFGVLLGLVTSEETTLEDVQSKGRCLVEVIGGNHTRQALSNMIRRGNTLISHVTMDVYKDLSDKEAIRLGLLHNSQHEHSKATSFEDKLKLFRRLYLSAKKRYPEQERKCKIIHRDMVADVMGIERGKTKSMLQVPLQISTLPEDIWTLFVHFTTVWKRKEILEQPRTELRQTHVKFLLGLKSENDQKNYLNDLIYQKSRFHIERTKSQISNERVEDLEIKSEELTSNLKSAEKIVQRQKMDIKELETKIKRLASQKRQLDVRLSFEREKVKNLQRTISVRDNAELMVEVMALSRRLERAEQKAARGQEIKPQNSKVAITSLPEKDTNKKRKLNEEPAGGVSKKKRRKTTKTDALEKSSATCIVDQHNKEIAVVEWTRKSVYFGILEEQRKLTLCREAFGKGASLNFTRKDSYSVDYDNKQTINFNCIICKFKGTVSNDTIVLDNVQKNNIIKMCGMYFARN